MSTKVKPCKNCGGTERYEHHTRATGACIPCHQKSNRSLESYYKNRERNMMDYKWRLNKLLNSAKNRATIKDRVFNISTEYLIELWDNSDGTCAVSGTPLVLEYSNNGGPHKHGPSLDRIDSSKGYEVGNVRLVTYHVNTALSNFGEEALLELANNIIDFNRGVN